MQASEPHAGPVTHPKGWLTDHRAIVTALLLIAHALAFRLAFPPVSVATLMPVAIALLTIAAVGAARMRTVLIYTLMVHFILWTLTMQWVAAVTAVGFPLKCIGMSLFTVLYVAIIRTLSRTPKLARWPFALLVPVVWTGVECLRGEIAFNGYPWYLAAHPFATTSVLWIQSADLFGAYFISFFAAALAGAALDIASVRQATSWRAAPSRVRFAVVAMLVMIGFHGGYGSWRLAQSSALAPGPRIAAVQTNLPQENKIGWTREQKERDLPEFINLTRSAVHAAHEQLGGLDLVVWPETMFPGVGFDPVMADAIARLGEDHAYMLRWQDDVLEVREEFGGTPILIGSIAWLDPQFAEQGNMVSLTPGTRYNSAYLLAGDPPFARYDKFFLTPFGETMPYISNWPWLEEKLLAIGARGMSFDLDAGPNLAPIRFEFTPPGEPDAHDIAVGTPICFEDSVAWVCRRMIYHGGAKRGDMLINISNDGWFGESDATRAQHLQIARFRCVENRVPMVRAVNTGFSASIDSSGRITDVIGEAPRGTPRREGWLVTQVVLDGRHTLYGRIGDVWAFACGLATAGMLVAAYFLRKRGSTS